jgi:catechol 2,3-dioxygenase-like lactoylglutathione lyase family enzyme
MARLNKVWTVTVYVVDRKRSLEFYKEKLGFEVALKADEHNWLELALPDGFTKLAIVEPRKDLGEDYYKWATQNIGVRTGISFEVDDIQAFYEESKAKGVKFSGPPEKAAWGGLMTTFVDLDGNEFMVVEDKEHYKRDYP